MNGKWERMREFTDSALEHCARAVDEDQHAGIPLYAGLALARTWLAELEPGGDWPRYRTRLARALHQVTGAEDSGSSTQFALWDGLHAAACHTELIDETSPGAGVTPS